MKILLTGITGILGSHLLAALSSQHEVYAIVRNIGQRTEKLSQLALPLGHIFDGDLEKEDLGLSNTTVFQLQSIGIDAVVHCASSVKFDLKYWDRTLNINKKGTERIIDLSKRLGVKKLHFISTAYAPYQRNPYELSKKAAEELVISSGLSYSIYRLGVVVGERQGCAINDFNGFYAYAMVPYFISRSLAAEKDGPCNTELPITICCSFTSTINMVPVDWVVSQLAMLIGLGTFGEVYHITHPDPPSSLWVLKTMLDHFRVKGIVYTDSKNNGRAKERSGRMEHFQKLFDKQTEVFTPYLAGEGPFDVSSVMTRLGSDYQAPGMVTREWLQGLLDYAIKHNFGRRQDRRRASL